MSCRNCVDGQCTGVCDSDEVDKKSKKHGNKLKHKQGKDKKDKDRKDRDKKDKDKKDKKKKGKGKGKKK